MKKLFLVLLFGTIVLFIGGWSYLRFSSRNKVVDETRTVFIKETDIGFELYRNGKPFFIRGASGRSHLKELADFGGNSIRVYDTLNLGNLLDEAFKNNLAVIVDIPIPRYSKINNLYLEDGENNILKQKVKNLVHKYKNHPALLIWNLGNEIDYPFVLRKNSFIRTFNELIEIIHKEDHNHPISTSIGGLSRKSSASIYIHSRKIDLLSFNSFGNVKNSNLVQILSVFGTRPYYYSEFGVDGPWEAKFTSWMAKIEPTSTKKAEQMRARYNIITDNKENSCLGSLIFYWGNKFETTATWFSLFKDDYKLEVIKEIGSFWQNTRSIPSYIGLDYMLVDGKGAYDNIIFNPNELKFSEVVFSNQVKVSVKIEWEIYPEAWFIYPGVIKYDVNKTIDCFVKNENNTASFITPDKEGPYRIFVYIYDQEGYFATTNTPFYVLNPDE